MKKSTFTMLLAALFLVQGVAQQVEQRQRPLLTERAADWCQLCGGWAWVFMAGLIEDNDDKAVIMSAHYDGNLSNPAAKEITDNFNGFYQPRFYLNENDVNATAGNATTTRTNVKTQVDAAFEQSPVANTGFQPMYIDGQIKVAAKVKFFQAAQGEYYLGLYLLEDNVIAYQNNIGNNANHRKLFRYSFTASAWGEPIANGDVTADQEFDLNFALTIGDPTGYEYEVVGVIWKKEGDKYKVVNTWSTKQIEVVLSATSEPRGLASFEVVPNLASTQATVKLQLAENQAHAALDVYDLDGRKMANLHTGTLRSGVHSFEINREMVGRSGLFLVRFSDGDGVSVRKVVFE
ncbi:MAG: Omp28-related outer membrane protein [Bacteroidetes bacterium]|nr:Omp28-related outer membrane protein [Bacteroidota bacterium]